MAFPVTINGRTYTLADFEGTNYVDGFPDALEDFVTQAGDIYNSTSTSSVAIGTGSKSFTTADSDKPYQVGTPLRIADAAAPATNFMDCIVTSYSGTSLVVDSIGFGGSGTKSSWTINIGGAKTVDGTLAVNQGGTGATTASAARTNLDVYSKTEADNKFLDVSGEASNVTINGSTTMNGDVTIGDAGADTLTVNATATLADATLTTADINGGTIDGVTIGGASAGAGTFTTITGSDDLNIDSGTLFVDASANAVGIGTTTVEDSTGSSTRLQIQEENGGGDVALRIKNNSTVSGSTSSIRFTNTAATFDHASIVAGRTPGAYLAFETSNGSEAGRFDSSGNLLISTTQPAQAGNTSDASAGIALLADNSYQQSRSGVNMYLNRLGSDGSILIFRKDGSTVMSIDSVAGGMSFYATGINNGGWYLTNNAAMLPMKNSVLSDNAMDLGSASYRFDDIFATNGTIQTSDRNEKQDIEELSDAEQRVAVAAKSLLRKFRWKSAVEEKGDDARIHFGIIAQDLQAAFEAEGLDAGRYGMFMYNEWWETYTDVPAVEAQDAVYETVTDEEGNETQVLVSEAVEAKEAYTRTDHYDTEEEAPEGAVKKSRMGVRYPELLAFIIAAI